MKIERVKRAAELRGIYFDEKRRWLNNVVGFGYEIDTGADFFQADTLEGVYREIMRFEKVKGE